MVVMNQIVCVVNMALDVQCRDRSIIPNKAMMVLEIEGYGDVRDSDGVGICSV